MSAKRVALRISWLRGHNGRPGISRTFRSKAREIEGITISGGGKTTVLETWGHGPYTLRNIAITVVLTSGSFQIGSATASAQTVNQSPWVTPAGVPAAVKLYWARR